MVFLARAVFLLSFICFFHCVMRRTRRSFHPTGERALLPLEFSIRIALFRPLFNTSVPVTCTSLPLLAPHRGTDLPRPSILPPINPLHDSPCSFPRVRKLPTNKTISISRFIYIYIYIVRSPPRYHRRRESSLPDPARVFFRSRPIDNLARAMRERVLARTETT